MISMANALYLMRKNGFNYYKIPNGYIACYVKNLNKNMWSFEGRNLEVVLEKSIIQI